MTKAVPFKTMSVTLFQPFGDRRSVGQMKFPAALLMITCTNQNSARSKSVTMVKVLWTFRKLKVDLVGLVLRFRFWSKVFPQMFNALIVIINQSRSTEVALFKTKTHQREISFCRLMSVK